MSLEIKNLNMKMGDFSLRKVNLSLQSNDYLVILGPSGCGKTSLLECIAGIKNPDEGSIRLNDEDLTDLAIEKRNVGFVYQSHMLFPHMNVYENVAYGLKIQKDLHIKEKVNEILFALHIGSLSNRFTHDLSGGEKQRVALARALVLKPRVLLLDEPLSALDPPNKRNSIKLLDEIRQEFSPTMIHVTHDHAEARALATKIAVMNRGEMVQVDSVENIFQRPSTKFVADFICAENVFEGEAEVKGEKTCIQLASSKGKKIELFSQAAKNGKVHVLIDPTDIQIQAVGASSSQENLTQNINALEGKLISVSDIHQMIQCTIDVGLPFQVHVTRGAYENLNLNVGSKLQLSFKSSSTHLI